MNPHPTNVPHAAPGRSRFRILRAFTAAAGVGVAGFVLATDSPPPAARATPTTLVEAAPEAPRSPDLVLARSALVALDADAELRGATFVVSVVDRVAVIGGPVSTPRQAQRAEETVRSVPGIADVRNTCFVSLGPDPLLRAVADRLESSLPPRPVMFELPGVLTGAMASAGYPGSGAALPIAAMAAANPPGTVVARKPTADLGVLGGPVGPAGVGSAALPQPGAHQAAPGVLTGGRGEVLAGVDAVRRTEARFAGLTVEVRGGTLLIGGEAPLVSDAWDFAKKLQAVPGVARVAVGAVGGR